MQTPIPFPSWPDVAADLVATAAGRAPADLVLTGARVVLVQTREVMAGWQVAIRHAALPMSAPMQAIASAPRPRWLIWVGAT